MASPYKDRPVAEWRGITQELIQAHPLKSEEIVAVVLQVWKDILASKIGSKPFEIGADLRPKPQIMGFFLHELIARELSARYPEVWRGEETGADKDLVNLNDASLSIEIKTSSHATQIFGNRSYAQEGSTSKKSKAGYYLAVNFGKFGRGGLPEIGRIRFGWLDHEDWEGQAAATGQQAHLSPEVERNKLLQLYP